MLLFFKISFLLSTWLLSDDTQSTKNIYFKRSYQSKVWHLLQNEIKSSNLLDFLIVRRLSKIHFRCSISHEHAQVQYRICWWSFFRKSNVNVICSLQAFTRKKKKEENLLFDNIKQKNVDECMSVFIYGIKRWIRSWTKLVMTRFQHAPSFFSSATWSCPYQRKKAFFREVFQGKFAFSFIRYSCVDIDGDNYCQIKDTLNVLTLEYKKRKRKRFFRISHYDALMMNKY